MDLEGDLSVLGDVEMEVPHFDFLDSVRKFNVLIALYFFSFYDEAYGNRVSEFCCDFTCLHIVFHLSYFCWLAAFVACE